MVGARRDLNASAGDTGRTQRRKAALSKLTVAVASTFRAWLARQVPSFAPSKKPHIMGLFIILISSTLLLFLSLFAYGYRT